jgi:hypothetical protein
MTYPRKIQNGVAVLTPPATLPEETPVQIEVQGTDQSWSNKTIEQLAREQRVVPIKNLSDLRIDWPNEDSVDELLALVREVRH